MIRKEYGSIGIMQPYFFPYMGYFQLINAVDLFILYDEIDYIRASWINRNRLLEVRRNPFYITVPLQDGSRSGRKISQMFIVDNGWRRNILNSVYYNYKRAPFFEEVYEIVENIINFRTRSLSDLNKYCITRISAFLNIDTEIEKHPDYLWLEHGLKTKNINDFMDELEIHLTAPSTKLLRCIAICRDLRISRYINLIGGWEIYPKREFGRNLIDIRFLEMNNFIYKQRADIFFSRLSIIDVLMNVGKLQTIMYLDEFTLK